VIDVEQQREILASIEGIGNTIKRALQELDILDGSKVEDTIVGLCQSVRDLDQNLHASLLSLIEKIDDIEMTPSFNRDEYLRHYMPETTARLVAAGKPVDTALKDAKQIVEGSWRAVLSDH